MNPVQSSVASVEEAPGYGGSLAKPASSQAKCKAKANAIRRENEEEHELTRAVAMTYGGFTIIFIVSAIVTYFWLPAVTPLYCVASILGLVGIVERFWGARRRRDLEEKLSQMEELSRTYLGAKQFKVVWGGREAHLKTGGVPIRQAVVTIMKTDLRGFSGICEKFRGPALMKWLTRYIATLEEVITEYGGMIKSIEGDALHAVFGLEREGTGPHADHRMAALRCGLALRARLSRLNNELRNADQPLTATRIGISTGEVTIGSLGSKAYMQYDAVGDTVNTAARLETYDKESMPEGEVCRIQAGASTMDPVKEQFSYESIGKVELQGKVERVEVYRVKSVRGEALAVK